MEDFYTALEETLSDVPSKDIAIILGDFNSKVGKTHLDHHIRQVGGFGLGERNDRGERLLDFCLQRNLSIMNTYFQHHPRRLYMWRLPGDRFRNQTSF